MNTSLILDCTIRDGGYVNNWKFTKEQVSECYRACSDAGVDYMEIGFRNFKTENNLKTYGDTFFCDEEYLNEVLGNMNGCKLAVMVTINSFSLEDFVPKQQSKINLVRVLMAYHGGKNGNDNVLDIKQLKDGVEQMKKLIELGYDVSFNIGRIDKINEEQLYEVCKIISTINVKYFTMADTYGSVDMNYIEKLIPRVSKLFKKEFNNDKIKIGFHAHDNCVDATCKALYSLRFGAEIIDGCILGYGRGSGNAKTELLMMNLNKNYNCNYDFVSVMNYGDKYIINYKECLNNLCYNVVYALSAYYGCHVTYAIEIIEKYKKLSITEISEVFIELRRKNKHMFFYENMFLTTLTELNSLKQ